MNVLVLNSGSSSIKYQVFDLRDGSTSLEGLVERIGETDNSGPYLGQGAEDQPDLPTDHRQALERIVAHLEQSGVVGNGQALAGIGHRVVHGGEHFHAATRIDAAVVEKIRGLIPLAPLHNPANLTGIEVALERFPTVPQVAVFDTAFHQTLPRHAYHYAIPDDLYRQHAVRRYGFHGTSHDFVSRGAAEFLQRPLESLCLITLHLGNGASAAAVQEGRCVDTSMGMTPLEGLMMGTRCGDLDPTIVFHVARETGWSNDRVEQLLNRESGLKGVCGVNDMRDVLQRVEKGDQQAELAVEMYCYRIRKYIGAYWAAMGRLDGIVFTAGIGENSAEIRRRVCDGLSTMGVRIDAEVNAQRSKEPRRIDDRQGAVAVLVVPTNEELEIARQTMRCID